MYVRSRSPGETRQRQTPAMLTEPKLSTVLMRSMCRAGSSVEEPGRGVPEACGAHPGRANPVRRLDEGGWRARCKEHGRSMRSFWPGLIAVTMAGALGAALAAGCSAGGVAGDDL